MNRIYATARAVALIVAFIAAFATIPYAATILMILGAISVLNNSQEDNLRTYLIAAVLLVGSKELAAIPGIGATLVAIFENIGTAAFGASALAAVLSVYKLTREAFMPKAKAA
jgi:hypothetical protein